MCDLLRVNYISRDPFSNKSKDEKVGNAEVLQSVKTENKDLKTNLDKQIRNSEIDGLNNIIVSSNSNSINAALVNLSVDKVTLSHLSVGDVVKFGNNVKGTVEFIDSATDDEVIKNNTVNVKVDESKKLFGINGKSTEIYGH